ncbi:MAG: hypothetical protein HYS55_00715, partial [Candidatus Omnitrophica bacterium]|nr:hypothetical protein [Candidatus Omnitrophota bacterium]
MHFKRTKPLFWKTTSFVVLFCFTVTTVAWSNPSLGSASLSLALPRPFRELGTLSLPEALGRVDEVYLPEGINSNSPLIVFLQDAHANLGAQEHIAQIANEVGKKLKIDAIFKEGGSGEADLTELRNFPDQKIKSSVAQFWMEEAVLSGIEREAIVNPKPYRFFGIEDQTAYETGGKYFVEAHTRSSDFLTPLKSLVQNNDTQRKQFYNPALFRFEELVSKFETKQELIPLVSLVANEARNLHINRWKYLEIEKFIDLILLELEGARTERFFEIQKTLEAKKLFEEMELLKGEIKEKLFQNKKERILDREAEILKVLKALVSLECTPQDFERFLKHRSSISKYVTKRKLNPKAIEAAEAFYQSAHERDQLLFSNVKQILEREQIKRAFLVAGGFHSPGMIEQFRKNKIPYVLITPQISERDLYDRYFARIAGKRASIEDFKSKRPNLANVSAYAAVSALLNGEEPKIIFNSMRLTKKRIEISGNVSDSARGIVQPVTSKKATIWNVFAYLRGARQYQLWKGLSGLLEFPSHSPPLWVGYNMIAIMTSISIALTKPIFQLKGNSPNNLVARPAVPINWAKVIADLAINWLFAVPISLSMLSKIGTDTLYAAHRNKVSVPFLFLGGNFDKESPRAEVRSTPVGLSTLAPQAMESLRAEVRIDLSRAQTIDQKTQLEVGGILIKGRNRWVIRSTKPNYVEVQSVDEKGVPVSKFRVPMFRGTFNGAKYISPVSEKPKIEKKEYKPAPQAIPTPVAAAITEKVQAPEPAKVIPKPEKQISSPVMPMTEQASQPEQVGELLSKDQAKFMLGYGFISKDELNQLLSDQRYSSYSHRDVLQ